MPTPHHFILWAPYSTAPGIAERLASASPAHTATVGSLVASGLVKFGGPLLSPRADLSAPSSEQEKVGSVLVYTGESLESVRKVVEADPFYIEGVWDHDTLQLLPMKAVV